MHILTCLLQALEISTPSVEKLLQDMLEALKVQASHSIGEFQSGGAGLGFPVNLLKGVRASGWVCGVLHRLKNRIGLFGSSGLHKIRRADSGVKRCYRCRASFVQKDSLWRLVAFQRKRRSDSYR